MHKIIFQLVFQQQWHLLVYLSKETLVETNLSSTSSTSPPTAFITLPPEAKFINCGYTSSNPFDPLKVSNREFSSNNSLSIGLVSFLAAKASSLLL